MERHVRRGVEINLKWEEKDRPGPAALGRTRGPALPRTVGAGEEEGSVLASLFHQNTTSGERDTHRRAGRARITPNAVQFV